MKKLLFLLLLSLAACSTSEQLCTGFEHYRNNPFQFPYPEYYLKAKVVEITSQHLTLQNKQIKINFFDLSATISKDWFDHQDVSSNGGTISFQKDNERSFFVYIEREQLMGCGVPETREANRDFCSAFNSTKEFYDKLYLLTPDDLRKNEYASKGNSWIVHQKGSWFSSPRQVTTIYKYKGNGFVAFRRDFDNKKESGGKALTSELVIFHQNNAPNAIVIGSRIDKNDELFHQILSTLE